MRTACLSILLCLVHLAISAQEERSHIRKGNKYFKEGKIEEASKEYNEAIKIKNDLPEGVYNLGNVEYQKKDFAKAAEKYETAAMMTKDNEQQAKAYHNMGNSFLEAKDYNKSIEAYKKALRLNPKDMDTKYNLAYAMQMLKNNPQEQQQDQEQNEDNKDEEKEDQENKQDQQQDGENEDQQDQEQQKQEQQDQEKEQDQQAQNKEGQGGEEEKQQPQPQEGQLSKEEAERLLEALMQEEQKVQEELANKKIKAEKRNIEKDW